MLSLDWRATSTRAGTTRDTFFALWRLGECALVCARVLYLTVWRVQVLEVLKSFTAAMYMLVPVSGVHWRT
jgi:hypothetical protein